MSQTCVLPSYTSSPSISGHTDSNRPLRLSVHGLIIDHGHFASGRVSVSVPFPILNSRIIISIVNQEVVTSKVVWKLFLHPQTKCRVISTVKIPVTDLVPNKVYTYPFSIQFPHAHEIPRCKCGRKHQTLPPTLNGSESHAQSKYIICAKMKSCLDAFAAERLVFAPRIQVSEPPKNVPVARRVAPHMAISARQITHNLLQESDGYCELILHARETLHIAKVEFALTQHVVSNKTGLVELLSPRNTLESFSVLGRKVVVPKVKWKDSQATVILIYDLKRTLVPLTIDYQGCYTGVFHRLNVSITTRGHPAVVLSVPFVLESKLPPAYKLE